MRSTGSRGLGLEEKTWDGETTLTLAVQAGLLENVKVLLENGASPHSTNDRKECPLLLGNGHPISSETLHD